MPAIADRYAELVSQFPPRPIRDDAGLAATIAAIDAVIGKKAPLTTDEEDYIELLGRLVEAYESETDPLPPMSGVEALRALLESNGMTQAQLAEQSGVAVATISEILNGKRSISPKAREAFAKRFHVPPSFFV